MKKMAFMLSTIILSIILMLGCFVAFAQEKWQGVDEAVIGKFAEEKGRQIKEPLIPLEGDAELFVFVIFSATGGFIAGYYWRQIVQR